MFFEQLQKLCNSNNISLTALVEDKLHMSRSNVTKWKDGKVPKIDTIQKISSYFNVSADYLLGNEQKNKPLAEARSLSDIENEILSIFHSLPEDKKQAFITVARSLKSPTNNSKDK